MSSVMTRTLRVGVAALVVLQFGIVSVAASSNSCTRANATKTVAGVRYTCTLVSSKLRWVAKSAKAGARTGVVSTTTLPKPTETVVHRTLSNALRNTTFQIALQQFPELAQGIALDSPITFNSLRMSVYGLNTVKPEFFAVPFNQKSQYEEAKMTFDPFEATVSVNVLRASAFGDAIDVSTGFESIFTERVTTTIRPSAVPTASAPMNLVLPLSKKLELAAGSYLIVLSFEWTNLGVLTVRLWGQESGTNTAGGKGGDLTKACSYTPTTDAYPQGRAYAGLGLRQWNGQADSTIGFGTRFVPATAKVTACIVRGEWGNDIFNPGDLDIALVLKN